MALDYINNDNISGARCTFVLDGQVVAYARSVSWSFAIEYTENRVLNRLSVESFSPVSYRTTLSFSMFRIPKQSLTTLGFFPKTGSTTSDQVTNALTIAPLTAVIVDNASGVAIGTFTGVKISSGSFSLDSGGSVLGTQVDCVATLYYDESELAASG